VSSPASAATFVVAIVPVVIAVLAAQPAPAPAPAEPAKTDWTVPARTKIDVDRTIGQVDPAAPT
jgi:hypothetical protein